MIQHPHVHGTVPGGGLSVDGLSVDGEHWVACRLGGESHKARPDAKDNMDIFG
jgi:hypothetical protein